MDTTRLTAHCACQKRYTYWLQYFYVGFQFGPTYWRTTNSPAYTCQKRCTGCALSRVGASVGFFAGKLCLKRCLFVSVYYYVSISVESFCRFSRSKTSQALSKDNCWTFSLLYGLVQIHPWLQEQRKVPLRRRLRKELCAKRWVLKRTPLRGIHRETSKRVHRRVLANANHLV